MKHLSIRVVVYGGLVVLAATVWAWALGFTVWNGVVVGGVLGLAVGIVMDLMMRSIWDQGELSSVGFAMFLGGAFIPLVLVITVIGAAVVFSGRHRGRRYC